MPTVVILATSDVSLADSWERQLPPGRSALRLDPAAFPGGTSAGFAAAVILDSAAEASLPAGLAKCPTIYVGEVGSLPFEQARMAGRAKVYLSYADSANRLQEFLPLIEEMAEKQSMLDLLVERVVRRGDIGRNPARSAGSPADAIEIWDFLEGAVENLENRDRLISEFRRASRHFLRASHTVFFLREADMFRADRGTSSFSASDPMVQFFERHPMVIDGAVWDVPVDPVAELAVRNRLALLGARLFVPIHENGRLMGLIALGVRDDGQNFDDTDRTRAVFFARLLRHFLTKSSQVSRLSSIADQVSLGANYFPKTLVLGPDEGVPKLVPLVVRALIGQVRQSRELVRAAPSDGQPFRASAGIVAETGGVWAFWEEASGEVHDAAARQRAGRRELLKEFGLTLSHEVGNSLVSLGLLHRNNQVDGLPPPLLETIRRDVAHLEGINRNFIVMQTLHEAVPALIDIREIVRHVGNRLGIRVEVGPDPVMLSGAKEPIEFALRALLETLAENRPDLGSRELSLQLRSTGEEAERTALLSIKGKQLELEGILPEPAENSIPNQGRFGVFLAKEIIRIHHGEIHAGPGLEGTEILISLRSL